MSEAWVLVPAAGTGERFSKHADKLLMSVGGMPLLVRTVETLLKSKQVAGAVVVCHPDRRPTYNRILDEYGHGKPLVFATGGPTRRASVYNGLLALPESASIVAIHDAARPLISPALVDAAIERVREGAAGVVVSVPMNDTVKQTEPGTGKILTTVDRSTLWRAQTPQVFPKHLILQAHEAIAQDALITDDAQLMEQAGLGPVEVLQGEERNLKITTQDDLIIAEAFLHPAHRH